MGSSSIPEILVTQVLIFSIVAKKKIDQRFKNKIKEVFQKNLENFIKSSCDSIQFSIIDTNKKIKVSKLISNTLKTSHSYRLISSLFLEKSQRLEFISSLVSLFIKVSANGNSSGHHVLDIFYE